MIKKFALVITSIALSTLMWATPVSADPIDGTSDLDILTTGLYSDREYVMQVCNWGTDSIGYVTLETTFDGFTPTSASIEVSINPDEYTPTNYGTYDFDTSMWTGQLDGGQCVVIKFFGNITVSNGETVTFTAKILSSALITSAINIDPNASNDEKEYVSNPIDEPSDMSVSTRLLTQGSIGPNSPISYEVTLTNVGLGKYYFAEGLPLGTYIVMPDGATLDTADDATPDDDVVPGGCSLILNDIAVMGPGVAAYAGSPLYGCFFNSTSPILPGQSTKFIINLTTGNGFTSGQTTIAGAISGNDQGSKEVSQMLSDSIDPFTSGHSHMMALTYNSEDLQVTINRCNGFGEVVTTNDACFTVSFSKPIHAPSFTVDDLVLSGGGNVYSFVQDSATQWTVRINGMTLGGTLTLALGENSVVDLSAINNDVNVLGVNTIRYETPTQQSDNSNNNANQTTAAGTLANTGSSTLVYSVIAISLLFVGAVLVLVTKNKKEF